MPSGPILLTVPNFSEGRRFSVIQALAAAFGRTLLDESHDPDHHRCVISAAGLAPRIEECTLKAAEAAVRSIDMRGHTGAHPRLGAIDVVPFVPVLGTGMELAAETAVSTAEQIWKQLRVPSFLYEFAARKGRPRALPEIRTKAFKSLDADFGDAPHETAGVCIVGARLPLVAFNVLVNGDLDAVRRVAGTVRESSGGLKHLRAIAVELDSRGCSQISMNLVRPLETTVADAYREVTRQCDLNGLEVIGSEIVGLVPRDALGSDPEKLGLSEPPKILEEALRPLG